jgi:hypothetical protein
MTSFDPPELCIDLSESEIRELRTGDNVSGRFHQSAPNSLAEHKSNNRNNGIRPDKVLPV